MYTVSAAKKQRGHLLQVAALTDYSDRESTAALERDFQLLERRVILLLAFIIASFAAIPIIGLLAHD